MRDIPDDQPEDRPQQPPPRRAGRTTRRAKWLIEAIRFQVRRGVFCLCLTAAIQGQPILAVAGGGPIDDGRPAIETGSRDGEFTFTDASTARGTSAAQPGEPLADLDSYIRRSMAAWQIPGLAVVVVKDDGVAFLGTYGVRQIGRMERVDQETIFPLNSNAKAFTALAVAILVDEGKLAWDDKVKKHLPWLELNIAYATENLTVRDLLSHRVAGGWGGYLYGFSPTRFSADEVLRRIPHLPPSTIGFRERFLYDVPNYPAAGKLIEKASGMPWEQFIRSRIFSPLRMSSAKTSVYDLWDRTDVPPCYECELTDQKIDLERARNGNVAVEHVLHEGKLEAIPPRPLHHEPNGSIYASPLEVVQWLRFQLNRGAVDGKRLLGRASFDEMHMPQIVVRRGQDLGRGPAEFSAYGFGWHLTSYEGYKVVLHGGGFQSYMALLPEKNIGIAVLANLPNQLRQALVARIFDAYLGLPQRDWSAELLSKSRAENERRRIEEQRIESTRNVGVRPSLPMPAYSGTYEHAAFGNLQVSSRDGALFICFEKAQCGTLEPWEGDKFRVHWKGPDRYKGFASFTTAAEKAASVTLQFPAVTFTRTRDAPGPLEETHSPRAAERSRDATSGGGAGR